MTYDWWADELNQRVAAGYEHALVHRGHIFFGSHTWTAFTSNATVGLVIETHDDTPNAMFTINFGGSGIYKLYETTASSVISHSGVTIPGTEITVYNQNRSSNNTPTTKLYYDPTVADLGTAVLEYGNTGVADTIVGSGGLANISGHWNLKSDTTYVLWLQNTSGSTGTYSIQFFWHE